MPKNDTVKGWVVCQVNVGQLPPDKADAYLEKRQREIETKRLPPGYELVMLRTRSFEDRIELLKF